MKVKEFFEELKCDFFAGVPDSLLSSFCDYLIKWRGVSEQHIIAANEGNCVGLAAGYYMATGKVPIVYLQNSGIGNIVNPVVSLLNEKVCRIPCLFFVGWRGEPGMSDEPQHRFQGEITHRILQDIGIITFTIESSVTPEKWREILKDTHELLTQKKQVAFIFVKSSIESEKGTSNQNSYKIVRENAISEIVEMAKDDFFVATTGKISRELFAVRETMEQKHERDFLTVGAMGHCSSIALGIAMQKPENRIWCLDGDGALLMHMGSMAVIGASSPKNLVHVVFNNEAHESVGGYPTVMGSVDLRRVAEGMGYQRVYLVDSMEQLQNVLVEICNHNALTLLEIRTAIGSRKDLGRPTISPEDNVKQFMSCLKSSTSK